MKAPFALAIVAAALLAPALAHAQAKRPVSVECSAKDSDEVGKGLCSSLRDAIAKSPRYVLLTSPGKDDLHGIILVSSTPIVAGLSSASSVVFGYAIGDNPLRFLGHQALATEVHQIDGQVASLLVYFDTLVFGEV